MKLLNLLLFLVLSISVNGQDMGLVQSLRKSLDESASVQQRSKFLDKLGQAFFGVNNDSILFYAEENIRLGKNQNYPKALATGLAQKGVAFSRNGRLQEGIKLFYEALEIRKDLRDKKGVANVFIDIGSAYLFTGSNLEDQGDYDRADSNYVKASKYYKDANELALESNDSLTIAKSIQNMASASFYLFDFEEAIQQYELSYDWFPTKMKERMLGELKMNTLSCYIELDSVRTAVSVYESAIPYLKKFRLHEKWASANLTISSELIKFEKKRAYKLLLEADSVAVLAGHKLLQAKVKLSLYRLEKSNQRMSKALSYFEEYSKLSSEVSSTITESKINQLELQYNTAEKDKKIAQQDKVVAQKKAEVAEGNAHKKLLLYGIVGLAVFMLVITVLFIQRLRFTKLERKREQEKYNEEIDTLLKNRELESIESLLDGREMERKNIARDLHDRLGSTLSAVRMYFEAAETVSDFESKSERYGKAYQLLDKAIDDTRGIAHNLVSGTLSKFGLSAALYDLKDTIEGTGEVQVDCKVDDVDRLSSEFEINIYRVVQEVFSNSLKHGNATKLTAEIRQAEDRLFIHLSDDGKGFDKSSVDLGMGLKNIEVRVKKLNGKLTLNSSPGKGVHYAINFTIKEDEKDNFGG